jgi:serine protease Do
VTARGQGTDIARVTFTSVQDSAYGHDGQTCSNWSLTYTMLHRNARWLIDRAVAAPGTPTPC